MSINSDIGPDTRKGFDAILEILALSSTLARTEDWKEAGVEWVQQNQGVMFLTIPLQNIESTIDREGDRGWMDPIKSRCDVSNGITQKYSINN